MIAWQSHEGPRISKANGLDIIDCAMCGFRHVVPLPDPRALEATYREAYYRDEKPTFLAHAGEDQDWAELAQNDRLEAFERLLPSERRRLLDIGSGPGFFLKTAKARGWRVLGIEPSRQAAKHARSLGLEVAEGFFNAETAPGLGRFDAIQLNNVLEHVPDPAAILIEASDLLEPTVFSASTCRTIFRRSRSRRAPPRRRRNGGSRPSTISTISISTSLAGLLERLDFTIAERTTSFPMELFLLMGEDYTADAALGRACHTRRKRFDQALEAAGLGQTRRAFYRALANAGLGREAAILAVKS